jgi:hypothetical protein
MNMAAERFNAEPGPKLFNDVIIVKGEKRVLPYITIYYIFV